MDTKQRIQELCEIIAHEPICNDVREVLQLRLSELKDKLEPSMFKDIKDFHEKFGLTYRNGPRPLDQDMANFRVGFLQEELNEYISATINGDVEGQFDALIDLAYVALGTAYLQGFDFEQGWNRVHEANMKKVRVKKASESKRGSEYDIKKPEGWTAPDLSDLVMPFDQIYKQDKMVVIDRPKALQLNFDLRSGISAIELIIASVLITCVFCLFVQVGRSIIEHPECAMTADPIMCGVLLDKENK